MTRRARDRVLKSIVALAVLSIVLAASLTISPRFAESREAPRAMDSARSEQFVLEGEQNVLASGSARAAVDVPAARGARGTVAGPDGTAHRGAWALAVTGSNGQTSVHAFEADHPGFAVALAPGRWRLRAATEHLAARARTLDVFADDVEPHELHLTLQPACTLRGAVRIADDSSPSGLPVALRSSDDGSTFAACVRRDGSFEFAGLCAGAYVLVHGDERHPIVAPQRVDLARELLLLPPRELPVLGSLDVRVLDAAGAALADVGVSGAGSRGGAIAGRTDASGLHHATFLPPGSYRVVASRAGSGRDETRVVVEPDAVRTVELRLR